MVNHRNPMSIAGIPRVSLLGSIHFLYISDPPKYILRSRVSIYACNTTVYVSTFKNLEDLNLVVHFSSDLAHVS